MLAAASAKRIFYIQYYNTFYMGAQENRAFLRNFRRDCRGAGSFIPAFLPVYLGMAGALPLKIKERSRQAELYAAGCLCAPPPRRADKFADAAGAARPVFTPCCAELEKEWEV
ncbi:MAG: hypothetical protein MR014_06950 [Oscillospiraceae bacterium]|nr:hypothetical protein [Oscillospiraceae bacterium]